MENNAEIENETGRHETTPLAIAAEDVVKRMLGGTQPKDVVDKVAELCRWTVDAVSLGDVCLVVAPEDVEALEKCGQVVNVPQDGDDTPKTPFVLRNGRLYTARNFMYERRVLKWLKERKPDANSVPDFDMSKLDDTRLSDGQKAAVRNVFTKDFSILTGGPGTGKTFTLAQAVMQCLNDAEAKGGRMPAILLAAPTAKAAARMHESLNNGLEPYLKSGELSDDAKTALPKEAFTLHRLLGPNPDFVTFKRNKKNPINADWIIIDEASMVGLPMFAKFVDAVKPDCRVTIVGDKDQLASVERGRVFGDLCDLCGDGRMLAGCLSALSESRRFPDDGQIKKFAAAVNDMEWEKAERLFDASRGDFAQAADALGRTGEEKGCIVGIELQHDSGLYPDRWNGFGDFVKKAFWPLKSSVEGRDKEFKDAPDGQKGAVSESAAKDALAASTRFRMLAALRHGPYGIEALNAFARKVLGPDCPVPVMVTKNDRELGVDNGDVGVVLPWDRETVWLEPDSDSIMKYGKENAKLRPVPRTLLGDVETAFATTVHKSQGSEFNDVAVVLPPTGERPDKSGAIPILTKEILYTAVTRTKKSVVLVCGKDALKTCVMHKVVRSGGLAAG